MNEKDRHYNTPRVCTHITYLIQNLTCHLNQLIYLIRKIEHKIMLKTLEMLLGSHYNETEFDPMGHVGAL